MECVLHSKTLRSSRGYQEKNTFRAEGYVAWIEPKFVIARRTTRLGGKNSSIPRRHF